MEQAITVPSIKLYKYRWLVLIIFCLSTSISFFQLLQFNIIGSILKRFYNVDDFAMDATGLVFFVTFIVGCFPIIFFIEKYTLKVSSMTALGMTLAGNSLKLLTCDPSRYWLVIVSQALCSIGLVGMANIPTKFASTWFGAKEVSTACAIVVLGSQLGAALGSVTPPYAVSDGTTIETANALYRFFIGQAITTAIIFLVTIVFFRSGPNLPPSLSQLQLFETGRREEPLMKNVKLLVKSKDYIFVLCSLALANAVFNAFGIILNALYTKYFKNQESDAGLLAMIAIISGGCIGSLIFGLILDKTHQFRLISFFIIAASCISLIGAAYTIISKNRVGAFITAPVLGFFLNSTLVVGYEFALEVSYPIPESLGCSLFNASNYTFSILITLIMEGIIQTIGYPYAMGFAAGLLVLAALNVLFISQKLNRRDANL